MEGNQKKLKSSITPIQAQRTVSDIGVELLDLFSKLTAAELAGQVLRFNESAMYTIQIQLEGEVHPRVFRICTWAPGTPKPKKEELGVPL